MSVRAGSFEAERFATRDLDGLIDLLRETAQVEILPRFRNLGADDIRTKTGPLDPVTIADEAAEARIATELSKRWPSALIVGEEGCARDASVLGQLAGAELAFVLDPIDGTANFAAGVPLFATMLAVVMRGETVAGLIHDPLGDETILGMRGGGAVLRTADGKETRLSVSRQTDPAQMSGKAGWRYLPTPLGVRVASNLAHVAASWDYRCAAYEYRVAICGTADFLLYGRMMPWDHLAGTLLYGEAGGHVARFDGSAYRGEREGGLLCAPDVASWQALHRTLLG